MSELLRDRHHEPAGTSARPAATMALPALTRPVGYAMRMAAFVAVVAMIGALLHEHAERFFLRNVPLNTLILSVLAMGIVLAFRAVLSLDPDVAWIERFRRGDPGVFVGLPPALLGPLVAMLRDPKAHLRLSATGMRSVLDGVDSRLGERRETLRYLIALLIFLGLLGTFWGLLLTANSVGETIRGLNVTGSDPTQMFETLRAGLEAPLSGMGTAFSTSLFGLASSLVLGFLDLQASQAQNRFANELESWLVDLAELGGGAASDEGGPALAYASALLERAAESSDELQRQMARVLDDGARVHAALRVLADRLASLTDELRSEHVSTETTAGAQREARALLERIAGLLETRTDTLDEVTRGHLQNLDRGVSRLIDEAARGRERGLAELRSEIRLLARTISLVAERDR